MAYFPQINSNFILSQMPYISGMSYDTVAADMETGMRWSFSRRGNLGLDGFLTGPLGHFAINFTNITDAEVATLLTFFRSQKSRYHAFKLLDPGGNLLQYSEDFTQSYWDKSVGVTVSGPTTDPFGHNKATQLLATSADSRLMGLVGPSDGGINGVVANVSVWLKAETPGQQVFLGFANSTFTTKGIVVTLSTTAWKRYSFTTTFWDDNYFRVVLGSASTWNSTTIDVFGFQVSPMKGEGPYVKTPGNFGYHSSVRFDTDSFQRQVVGPNQNMVSLPCVDLTVEAQPPGAIVSAELSVWAEYQNVIGTITGAAAIYWSFDGGASWSVGFPGLDPSSVDFPSTPFAKQLVTQDIPGITQLAGFEYIAICLGTLFADGVRMEFRIYDTWLTITYSNGAVVKVRPHANETASNGTGNVVSPTAAYDADSNPPVTDGYVYRTHFSGLSSSPVLALKTWG